MHSQSTCTDLPDNWLLLPLMPLGKPNTSAIFPGEVSYTKQRGFFEAMWPFKRRKEGSGQCRDKEKDPARGLCCCCGVWFQPSMVQLHQWFNWFLLFFFFCTVVVLQLSMYQNTSWQALLPSPDGIYSLAPRADPNFPLSQAPFAVCGYLLEVSFQVKGAKMDECPSGRYTKTRKQQLCDSEYLFSLSWPQLISATLITHKKISHRGDVAVTTTSTALQCLLTVWISAKTVCLSVCLCSGWSPVAVEQWATQPDVHRDSWAGRVSEPGPVMQLLPPLQSHVPGDPRCCRHLQ